MQEGTFVGLRIDDCTTHVYVVQDNHVTPLDPCLHLRRHSPAGFNWSYGGSGPAQLALAILVETLDDGEAAALLYQRFKFEVVAHLPRAAWTLYREEVERWVMTELYRRISGDVVELGVSEDVL